MEVSADIGKGLGADAEDVFCVCMSIHPYGPLEWVALNSGDRPFKGCLNSVRGSRMVFFSMPTCSETEPDVYFILNDEDDMIRGVFDVQFVVPEEVGIKGWYWTICEPGTLKFFSRPRAEAASEGGCSRAPDPTSADV